MNKSSLDKTRSPQPPLQRGALFLSCQCWWSLWLSLFRELLKRGALYPPFQGGLGGILALTEKY